jgi:hypothetical protein
MMTSAHFAASAGVTTVSPARGRARTARLEQPDANLDPAVVQVQRMRVSL